MLLFLLLIFKTDNLNEYHKNEKHINHHVYINQAVI